MTRQPNKKRPYLLGKWRDEGRGLRPARGFKLVGHMVEVMDSARKIMEETGSDLHEFEFGEQLHAVMALPCTYETFKRMVYAGAWIHDLGKIGPEFQDMLWGFEEGLRKVYPPLGTAQDRYKHTGYPDHVVEGYKKWKAGRSAREKDRRQLYRHEFLSAVLAWHPALPIRSWLQDLFGDDWTIPIWAGAGHHRKFYPDRFTCSRDNMSEDDELHLLQHLGKTMDRVGRFCSSKLKFETPRLSKTARVKPCNLLGYFDQMGKDFPADETPLSAAVKWCVVLADVYGSVGSSKLDVEHKDVVAAMWKEFGKLERRGRVNFEARITKKLGQNYALREFQSRARIASDAVCSTSTGSGKTVAGFAWASTRKNPLLWAAPTTELANQAALEYGLDSDAIRHSRAWMEGAHMLPVPGDEDSGDDDVVPSVILPLRADVTFTTVDQVIGPLSFRAQSVLWLPLIVWSQVVFDEFHAYRSDKQLRYYQNRFLQWFPGIPTFHMTATAFEDDVARLKAARKCGVHLIPSPDDEGDNAPRYRFHRITPEERFDVKLPEGSLHIANTVKRVQALGREQPDAHVYHSRFKYERRRDLRLNMVDLIGRKEGLVVASPIAELGFDVNASAMLTEMCPPSSLIQRVGRVNRGEPEGVKDIYVYMPEDGMPYNRERYWEQSETQWHDWWAWLASIEGRDVSTRELRETVPQDTISLMLDDDHPDHHRRALYTRVAPMRHLPFHEQVLLLSDVHKLPSTRDAYKLAIPALLWGSERREKRLRGEMYRWWYYVDWDYTDHLGLIMPERKSVDI